MPLPSRAYVNLATLAPSTRLSLVERKTLARAENQAEQRIKHKVEQANTVLNALELRLGALDAELAPLLAQVAALTKRKSRAAVRITRIEDRILTKMQDAGLQLLAGLTITMSAKSAPASLIVDDVTLIPARYMRQPETPAPQPDKVAIKTALSRAERKNATPEEIAAAAEIAGVRLTQKISLVRK